MTIVEWDEDKRLKAIEKHGLDFRRAVEVLEADHLVLAGRAVDEIRRLAIGPLGGVIVAVCFSMRGDTTRLVTMRRARRDERAAYFSWHDGRDPQTG